MLENHAAECSTLNKAKVKLVPEINFFVSFRPNWKLQKLKDKSGI